MKTIKSAKKDYTFKNGKLTWKGYKAILGVHTEPLTLTGCPYVTWDYTRN